jgi:hypothetical protein
MSTVKTFFLQVIIVIIWSKISSASKKASAPATTQINLPSDLFSATSPADAVIQPLLLCVT